MYNDIIYICTSSEVSVVVTHQESQQLGFFLARFCLQLPGSADNLPDSGLLPNAIFSARG
jgi:hypothetical protein